MRFLTRSLVGAFMLAVTLGLLAFAVHTAVSAFEARMAESARPQMARERVFSVQVLAYNAATVTPELRAFGEVRARRSLELRATAAGRVVELATGFEDGAPVSAGQLLLRIDPSDAQAARDLSAADLARAEAELRDAGRAVELARQDLASAEAQQELRARALERRQNLAERGVGSEAAVEEAELALASALQAVVSRRQAEAQAEARLDQAATALTRQRITLAEAERRLADTEMHAGFAGVLADVGVVAGGQVAANERLARVIDPDDLEVAFRVSTAQYARLLDANGALLPSRVVVSLDVEGAEIASGATLTRVSAAVGEGQTGRLLYAQLDAPRGFRPGDFVTLRVQEPALEGVMALPASAVDSAGQVLVLGQDDRLELAAVEVLRRQADLVIVRADHLAGRELVAERSPMLGAGIRIRPLRDDPDEAAAAPGPELVALDPDRRAELIAFVQANRNMPEEARARLLAQLEQEMVPAQVIARIEARMGG